MKAALRVSALAFLTSFVGCAGCGEHYSEGMRTGVLVKFSQKGVIWKSWEGQLNLGGVTQTDKGAVPTVWEFSVTDPSIAEHLQKNVGKTFTIQYHQWALGPVFQDSDYTARTAVLTSENEKK
jgi:hypothetical protein